jgi:hypothetical protein
VLPALLLQVDGSRRGPAVKTDREREREREREKEIERERESERANATVIARLPSK